MEDLRTKESRRKIVGEEVRDKESCVVIEQRFIVLGTPHGSKQENIEYFVCSLITRIGVFVLSELAQINYSNGILDFLVRS